MVANVNELSRVRRRIDRRFGPCEAFVIPKPSEEERELSVEEAAYNAYKRDPQGTTDRLDLADNSDRRELPWWMLVAIVAVAAGVVLVVLGMTAMKHVE
jgi:hypothetical protein